ncbi:hypothetical protein CBL_13899 [Carabus blaptoides fortunei]
MFDIGMAQALRSLWYRNTDIPFVVVALATATTTATIALGLAVPGCSTQLANVNTRNAGFNHIAPHDFSVLIQTDNMSEKRFETDFTDILSNRSAATALMAGDGLSLFV